MADITGLTLSYDGQLLTLDSNGRAVVKVVSAGHNAIIATATNADGVTGTATADLKVRDPANTTAPAVSLTGVSKHSTLAATTALVGTVASGNLDSYTLTYQSAKSGSSAITLASGTAAIERSAAVNSMQAW